MPSAVKTATLDVDATVIHCDKRSANALTTAVAATSRCWQLGYQPVLALWAEQDVIVADEFRDGNVPAGSGNRRVVRKAIAALPGGIGKIYLRGDSALYEHELMRWLDEQAIGYAISADMSPQLAECIAALPEDHWKADRQETDAIREWAEVNYLPSDGIWKKDAIRRAAISPSASAHARASCCATATGCAHFCIVTNRSDPEGGSGLDLIRWHRQKAGTIEHAHDVLMKRTAGAPCLVRNSVPTPRGCASRDPLQPALRLQARRPTRGLHSARPKRLRFSAPQHRREGCPPCRETSCAVPNRSRKPSPAHPNPLRPQSPRPSRGLRSDSRSLGPATRSGICAALKGIAGTVKSAAGSGRGWRSRH